MADVLTIKQRRFYLSLAQTIERGDGLNPAYIPRNHLISGTQKYLTFVKSVGILPAIL